MTISAWFIGSITIPAQTFNINVEGAGNDPIVIPAGTYYLRSATAALSLVDVVASAMNTQQTSGSPFAEIFISRDRHVGMSFDGASISVAITWGTATILRDLFGFDANLTAALTQEAPNISPLHFSPGYMATPTTPQGFEGYTVPQQSKTKSADGEEVYTDHYGEEVWNEFAWTHIMPERLMLFGTTAAQGGTFHQFHLQCSMLGGKFLWHEEIDEDDASATAVTWDTAKGPYVLREEFPADWYKRNVPFAEVSSPLELPVHRVAEYS